MNFCFMCLLISELPKQNYWLLQSSLRLVPELSFEVVITVIFFYRIQAPSIVCATWCGKVWYHVELLFFVSWLIALMLFIF